jgi:hypothetical protein
MQKHSADNGVALPVVAKFVPETVAALFAVYKYAAKKADADLDRSSHPMTIGTDAVTMLALGRMGQANVASTELATTTLAVTPTVSAATPLVRTLARPFC